MVSPYARYCLVEFQTTLFDLLCRHHTNYTAIKHSEGDCSRLNKIPLTEPNTVSHNVSHFQSISAHSCPSFIIAKWALIVLILLSIRPFQYLDPDGLDAGLEQFYKVLTLYSMCASACGTVMLHTDYGYRLSSAVLTVCLTPASVAFIIDSLARRMWYRGTLAICCVLLLSVAWQYLLVAFSKNYNLDTHAPACPLCGREAKIWRLCPWWMEPERRTKDPTSDAFMPELMWCNSHQAYECNGCAIQFESPEELAIHLLENHVKCNSYCPSCLKRPRQYEY